MVFCEGCIKHLVTKNQGKHFVTCPNCRKDTTIPGGVEEGVARLQKEKAFYISHLTEIQGTLEKVSEVDVSACSLHEDKVLEFHCRTCDEMICARCAV